MINLLLSLFMLVSIDSLGAEENPYYSCMNAHIEATERCDFSMLDQRYFANAERSCALSFSQNGGDITKLIEIKRQTTQELTDLVNSRIVNCNYEGYVDLNVRTFKIDIISPSVQEGTTGS